MKLFNSYTNTIEEFKPIEENKVKMYVCGPTVYDYAHLGHARCYITWDVLYRYLKFKGYDVTYCRNVTDVDEWGKRRFAYEIQKMKEGFYYFVHFEAESTVPAEVEQRIRIMDNVLRYLCVKEEA